MRMKKSPSVEGQGFTLMEVLIVIAVLMLLFIILLLNVRMQIAKAHDIQRKTDLNKIQKTLEEYFNDNETYPPNSVPFSHCGGTDFVPYLSKVLCDPVFKTPYVYVVGQPTAKDGYLICAKLEYLADPDITRIGCDPVKGCGWKVGYNYCVGSGMLVTNIASIENGGGGTPTPTAIPGIWACSHINGYCDQYDDPQGAGCPHTYQFGCMNNGVFMCGDPKNRCTRY